MESCEIELFGGEYDGHLVVVPKPPPPEFRTYTEVWPSLVEMMADSQAQVVAKPLVYKQARDNPYKYYLT